jgi:hypothetical protein
MTAINETHTTPQWQTFNVVGGAISRNKAGQVEGILELASGMALTFMCYPDGVHWTWLPEEPNFVPDELVDYDGGNTVPVGA